VGAKFTIVHGDQATTLYQDTYTCVKRLEQTVILSWSRNGVVLGTVAYPVGPLPMEHRGSLPQMGRENLMPQMERQDLMPRIERQDLMPQMERQDLMPQMERQDPIVAPQMERPVSHDDLSDLAVTMDWESLHGNSTKWPPEFNAAHDMCKSGPVVQLDWAK
jgi:hypothetical protein